MHIRREIDLDADLARVWHALTDRDELSDWLGGPVELEMCPGGNGTIVDDEGIIEARAHRRCRPRAAAVAALVARQRPRRGRRLGSHVRAVPDRRRYAPRRHRDRARAVHRASERCEGLLLGGSSRHPLAPGVGGSPRQLSVPPSMPDRLDTGFGLDAVFGALADPTRRHMVERLVAGGPETATALAAISPSRVRQS